MKDGNVIEVRDVYKKYKNYFDKSNTLKEKIIHRGRNKYQEYWVLNGIDFEVKRGEAIGLVGKNGCGKSTTLKLLTKIIYPDHGSIEINGRVSSLLELGAGFHPDLSGYENIYLNAAVFGLTRKEIDRRVDEIIRFSELREFINNPIRTYSSGMYMKLAFSVAINVDADILLIDEILGVGDVNFQAKCFEKLIEIKEKGTTIVIVSHATGQIEKICDRSLWLEDGTIRMEGLPKDVHECYLNIMEERRIQQKRDESEEKKELERLKSVYSNERQRIQKGIEGRERERMKRREKYEEIEKRRLERKKVEGNRQQELLILAEKERKCQEKIIGENNIREQFYEKENQRLEHVVKEKNIEIERLENVILEKEDEVDRLNAVVLEKEDEVGRLDIVVSEKDNEINRLNTIILEKNYEINSLNTLL